MNKAESRLYDLKFTSMSHQPGDEHAAMRLQEVFRREFEDLETMFRYASNLYATPNDIKPDEKEDEGVMRVIQD